MQGNNPAFFIRNMHKSVYYSKIYAEKYVKLDKYSVCLYIYTINICIFVA